MVGGFAFDGSSRVEVMTVLANCGRETDRARKALVIWIQQKQTKGRKTEDILTKLCAIESTFINDTSLHCAFRQARIETRLPRSPVLPHLPSRNQRTSSDRRTLSVPSIITDIPDTIGPGPSSASSSAHNLPSAVPHPPTSPHSHYTQIPEIHPPQSHPSEQARSHQRLSVPLPPLPHVQVARARSESLHPTSHSPVRQPIQAAPNGTRPEPESDTVDWARSYVSMMFEADESPWELQAPVEVDEPPRIFIHEDAGHFSEELPPPYSSIPIK